MESRWKMRRRIGILLAVLLLLAIIVPFFALQVQGDVDAGEDQTVYVDDTVSFNATTTENASSIVSINWDFGDGDAPVNGTSPDLLNTTTHVYNETGTYEVTLSVEFNSELNRTDTDSLTVTVVVNVPPVADAGPDQTVEQTGPDGAEVTLNGSASTDPYGDVLTYNWTWLNSSAMGVSPTVTLPPGETNVTLTVSDGELNATDTVTITVLDTAPPYVNAGEDMTVEASSSVGAEVMLEGEATDDVDMDLDYVWSEGDTILGTDANLTVTLSLGSHVLALNATDDSGNTGTDTVTIEAVDTTPPEVDAGEDMTVEAGYPAMIHGSATDAVDSDLDYVWSEGDTILGTDANLTVTLSLGSHVLALNATDDSGNTGTDTVTIEAVDTTPPEVDAGEDMTVEAGYPAMIHGSATDAVDSDLDYVWKEGDTVLGTEADLNITFDLGTHVLTLSATDDSGNTGTDTVTIEAVDTTPPEINVSVAPDIMWPPNHKYADVETVVIVHDVVDPSPSVVLVSVTSNEADNAKGDGNTVNDIVILGDTMFKLRAERSGTGQGRVYTITYSATDASGNSAEAAVTIVVPHNK
ncbi:PKD domain-containing protein [Candidatus Bathyarchaeota archaeon]|nr:PKD domain-containing protein [Candidatus Bathyarchaeota archaeon]